jgi:hypothetical protein
MTDLLETKERSENEHGKPVSKKRADKMQVGVDSFAAALPDDGKDSGVSASDSIRNLVERIALADQVGLDVFGVGEHHRREFLDSAPVVVLAAAAALTKRIRLTSAVTVLSAADPVRVFQNFATLVRRIKSGEIAPGKCSTPTVNVRTGPRVQPQRLPPPLRLLASDQTGSAI